MLTSQEKSRLRNLLRTMILNTSDPNGVKTAKLPEAIRNEMNVDWHEHRLGSETFSTWLCTTLPEFVSRGH